MFGESCFQVCLGESKKSCYIPVKQLDVKASAGLTYLYKKGLTHEDLSFYLDVSQELETHRWTFFLQCIGGGLVFVDFEELGVRRRAAYCITECLEDVAGDYESILKIYMLCVKWLCALIIKIWHLGLYPAYKYNQPIAISLFLNLTHVLSVYVFLYYTFQSISFLHL